MSMRRSAFVLATLGLAASGSCGCSSGNGGEGGGAAGTSSSSSATTSSSSGSGGPGTVVADCFQYTGWDGTTPAATFSTDVLPIFRASCSTVMACHGSETPPTPGQHFYGTPTAAGAMTAAQIQEIFTGAVGAPSIDEPDMDVIKPGDPQHSFMMYKLDGMGTTLCSTLACNSSATTCLYAMPYALPQLSLDMRNAIRRWIAQGANND